MIESGDVKNASEAQFTIPSNAKYYAVSFQKGDSSVVITPQTVGHIGIYINNAIDELKNDLSDSLPVGTILTVEADTPMSSDMWRFLNTGKMTYQNGGALVEMGTMIYQKIK